MKAPSREPRVTPLPSVTGYGQSSKELVPDAYSAGAVWAVMESDTVS
jgi:hypothetical protein